MQWSRFPTRGFWCHSVWDQRCNFWSILQKLKDTKICSKKHIKLSSGDFSSRFFKTQKNVFCKSDNKPISKKFVLWVHGPSIFCRICVKLYFFYVLKFWETKSPDESLIWLLEHTLLTKNICGIAQMLPLWPDSEWHQILITPFQNSDLGKYNFGFRCRTE